MSGNLSGKILGRIPLVPQSLKAFDSCSHFRVDVVITSASRIVVGRVHPARNERQIDVEMRIRKCSFEILNLIVDVERTSRKSLLHCERSRGVVGRDADFDFLLHLLRKTNVHFFVVVEKMTERIKNSKRFRINRLLNFMNIISREDVDELLLRPRTTKTSERSILQVERDVAPTPLRSIRANEPNRTGRFPDSIRFVLHSKSCPLKNHVHRGGVDDGGSVPQRLVLLKTAARVRDEAEERVVVVDWNVENSP